MVNRPNEVATSTECVIDYDRDTLRVRQLGDLLEIGHIVPRVADALHIYCLGLVINGSGQVLCRVPVHKLGVDSQPWQSDLELVVRAAIQVGRGHDVVAHSRQRSNRYELCCLSGCGCECAYTSFESCHALLEDIDRGLMALSD